MCLVKMKIRNGMLGGLAGGVVEPLLTMPLTMGVGTQLGVAVQI